MLFFKVLKLVYLLHQEIFSGAIYSFKDKLKNYVPRWISPTSYLIYFQSGAKIQNLEIMAVQALKFQYGINVTYLWTDER